jgi:hypothetical protein
MAGNPSAGGGVSEVSPDRESIAAGKKAEPAARLAARLPTPAAQRGSMLSTPAQRKTAVPGMWAAVLQLIGL